MFNDLRIEFGGSPRLIIAEESNTM